MHVHGLPDPKETETTLPPPKKEKQNKDAISEKAQSTLESESIQDLKHGSTSQLPATKALTDRDLVLSTEKTSEAGTSKLLVGEIKEGIPPEWENFISTVDD